VLSLCEFAPAQTTQPQSGAPTTQPGRRGGRGARGPAPQSVSPRDALPFTPADFKSAKPNLPTLVIAGDSTADKGPDAWHRGWAAVLIDYFDADKINVVNRARGGRSFRTFVHEGLWDQLIAEVKPGDVVMIQFGHNDGGDIHNANGRADLPGLGNETQEITRADGSKETVHTFGWYTRKFVQDVRAKDAMPILMTPTAYNRWVNGKYDRRPGVFSDITRQIAEQEKVPLMYHTNIISDHFEQLGEAAVSEFFKADFLHTTTPGAIANAESFIAGVKGLDIQPLVDDLNEKGKAIPAYSPAATKPSGTN
jgi:lysophospholipase L1-like esterase